MARGEKGPGRQSSTGSAGSQSPRTGDSVATAGEGTVGETPAWTAESAKNQRVAEADPWRLRNWRLRTKLLAVLLIPSVAALILGAMRVTTDYSRADALERNSEHVELSSSSYAVVHALQRERDLTVDYIASGRTAPRAALDQQRARVNQEVGHFRAAVENARSTGYPKVANYFGGADSQLNRLGGIRQVTDGSAYPADAALRSYTDSIGSLLFLGEQVPTMIDDRELVRLALASNALERAKEQESVKRAVLAKALRMGKFPSGGERELHTADAALESALRDFTKWANPADTQAYSDTVAGLAVDEANSIEETVLVRADANEGLANVDPHRWFSSSTETVNLTSKISRRVQAALRSEVDSASSAAQAKMYITGALVIGVLALAFAIALLVARSLLLPLRTLRRSALDVADNRLPEAVGSILKGSSPEVVANTRVDPIPVHTREEIGRVARSFDAVNSQALRLAAEQALLRNNVNDLFVNLARRSQSLVERQLSLIDTLEQEEQDPDQLSNLFELDHLATRMRRNNENLLILGGTDLARRMTRPVPLTEVIGAAVSEVEQYARIVVADAPELALQGRVVNDFIHLVAELLENATVYSDPSTEVDIRTAYRRQELIVEIRDRGMGIDSDDLVGINERLLEPPQVDVAVSRRMGLYVVAQLARRHNIRVRLQNDDGLEGGVTATVRLSGEYVMQLTPNGPMPMPDVQRAAVEDRDPLSETGSHKGLAAAFGRGGADSASLGEEPTQRPELPSRRESFFASEEPTWRSVEAAPVPSRETSDDSGGSDHVGRGTDNERDDETAVSSFSESSVDKDDPEKTAFSENVANQPTDYSVHIARSDSFGISDVPQWTPEPVRGPRAEKREKTARGNATAFTSQQASEQEWPSEDSTLDGNVPEVFDGQCGLPPAEPGGLFHSPFEAEKTANFRPVSEESDDLGQDNSGSAEAESELDAESSTLGKVGGRARPDFSAATPARDVDDAPTERLPIYEAVLSQWFRESDVDEPPRSRSGLSSDFTTESAALGDSFDRSGRNGQSRDAGTNGWGRPRSRRLAERSDTGTISDRSDRADDSAGQPTESAEPELTGHSAEPTAETPRVPAESESWQWSVSQDEETPSASRPRPRLTGQREELAQETDDPGWGSADAGWEAAEALVHQARDVSETTTAGLPKRVPKSNLVPGSADSHSHMSAPRRTAAASRSAEAVRGRMSNFQQGVRRGRHAKEERVSTEQPNSIPSRPEEQE